MRRGVSRWVMPKTVEAKSAKKREGGKVGGMEHQGFPPRAQIVGIDRGNHIQQPGHDDEAGAVIGGGDLRLVGAEAQETG